MIPTVSAQPHEADAVLHLFKIALSLQSSFSVCLCANWHKKGAGWTFIDQSFTMITVLHFKFNISNYTEVVRIQAFFVIL